MRLSGIATSVVFLLLCSISYGEVDQIRDSKNISVINNNFDDLNNDVNYLKSRIKSLESSLNFVSNKLFWNNNGNNIYNLNNGYIGIGTSSPGKLLDILGASFEVRLKGTDTNSDSIFTLDRMGTGGNYINFKRNNVPMARIAEIERSLYLYANGYTEYVKIDSSGILNVTKDIMVSSRPCATLWWYLNGSSVTTIVTPSSFVLVAGTSTLSTNSSWFAKYGFNNGHAGLRYVGLNTHKFLANLTGCIRQTVASPTVAEITIYRNGANTNYECSPSLAAGGDDAAISLGGLVSLATNDYIEVYVSTTDADDIAIDHLQLSLIPLD